MGDYVEDVVLLESPLEEVKCVFGPEGLDVCDNWRNQDCDFEHVEEGLPHLNLLINSSYITGHHITEEHSFLLYVIKCNLLFALLAFAFEEQHFKILLSVPNYFGKLLTHSDLGLVNQDILDS